ncbi:ABC transporter substrate-binding protein [Streptomyces kaempferi]
MSGAMARRRFLALSGGLALTGGLAACSSPLASGLTGSQPNTADVIFWNLFTGGDGANMVLMEKAFRKANPGTTVEATILGWGNPYYTKLALATASGTPPDVGITHLSRLPLLAASGLLEPIERTPSGNWVSPRTSSPRRPGRRPPWTARCTRSRWTRTPSSSITTWTSPARRAC